MVIDFALLAVFAEQSSENTLSSHPEDLGWETGLCGTLSFTDTSVSSLSLGGVHLASACARVSDC